MVLVADVVAVDIVAIAACCFVVAGGCVCLCSSCACGSGGQKIPRGQATAAAKTTANKLQ